MGLRGTGEGICCVEQLSWDVDDGVVESHQSKVEAEHSGGDVVQLLGTQQGNKRFVVCLNGNRLPRM